MMWFSPVKMTRKVSVSVIIPARNEEDFLSDTIRSVREQSYLVDEIIVVSNDSVDNTLQIARSYADMALDSPVKGTAYSKNLGARAASGDLIVFLDADTTMDSSVVEKMIASYDKGFSGGKVRIRPLDDDGLAAKISCVLSDIKNRVLNPFPFIDGGTGACTFISREMLDILTDNYGGPYNPGLQVMEDVDIALKIKKNGSFDFLTDTQVYTSMRRFQDEGYVKTYLVDMLHFISPRGRSRLRWG